MTNLFLERLRSETADLHKALEQNAYARALMSAAVTAEIYADYLRKMYGYVSVFEAKVFPVLKNILPGIDEKRKSHLLEADLRSFSIQPQSVTGINEASIIDLTVVPAAAYGGLYVMEGSVLGGMVILKHLQDHLGEAISEKASYFMVYGQSTGSRWKTFLEKFCAFAAESGNEEAVINGAVHTFRSMNEWMHEANLVQA